ncbi:BCCT family transporter [Salarchaeum sp. JOR-1]|uniref:BCCT family transporter n=1 Tax=Salarchaeum sp. JOR-1 TaxID=2599399 RepID=UPI0011983090|nr:BCCT family transporter [Salarchaeum sp. JOR-1]QDX40906.1 BCCT family transporter [Salarchaeum sp. JOR-1]
MTRLARLFGLESTTVAERLLFALSVALSVALAAAGILYPDAVGGFFASSFAWVTVNAGWWFILLGFALTVFFTWLCVSRYGDLRVGGPDADPEFGTVSWVAMAFTVGYSIAVLFWGVAEPVSIVTSPPPRSPVPGASPESLALAFTFLHDILPGLVAWYLPFAVLFGLVAWQHDNWKASVLLEPLGRPFTHPAVAWLVDVVTVLAIVGGLGTSLGFIGQQLSSIVRVVFGFDASYVTLVLFLAVAVVFVVDVFAGLRRGIQNAARVAVAANVLLTVVLFVLGPTGFILDLGLDAMGVWLSNLARLSLYTAPTSPGNWPQNWTSFWWAWWAAWGVFVGSFVARISKGRTIREVFVGLCIAPAAFLVFQHSVLGGLALAPGNLDPVAAALAADGNAAALSTALTLVPAPRLVGALALLALAGYIVTSLDSAVYMLAAITLGEREPNVRNRAAWGIAMVGVGVMTTFVGGGTTVLESFSTTLALPLTALYVLVAYATYVVAERRYDK